VGCLCWCINMTHWYSPVQLTGQVLKRKVGRNWCKERFESTQLSYYHTSVWKAWRKAWRTASFQWLSEWM